MRKLKYISIGILALIGLVCTLAANTPDGVNVFLGSTGLTGLALAFWITGL